MVWGCVKSTLRKIFITKKKVESYGILPMRSDIWEIRGVRHYKEMINMEEKYALWARVVEDMKDAVKKAEHELTINQVFLKAAESKLKTIPKPKKQDKDDSIKAVKQLTG